MKFKPNDKVICLNPTDTLKLGGIYTIDRVHEFERTAFWLKGVTSTAYYDHRFKKCNSYLIKERLGIK